jgi:Holliday junction DNA helicase RuvA
MFAKLKGRVDYIEEGNLTLDVNGVGYEVFVPTSLMQELSLEQEVNLHVQTLVKEDAIALYGFKDANQKKLFNLLITVQGVGAKIALVILSKMSFQTLQQAIMFEDINTLKTIPGIGIKVAQRLCNELKDKITKISSLNIPQGEVVSVNKSSNQIQDAIMALQGLGYSTFEINKAIAKINTTEDASSENIIKDVLQYFAKGMK